MALSAGRVLGVDPGSVRIGISVSDSRRTMAFPRDAVRAGDAAIAAIVGIALEEQVTSVVVGQPLSLAGASGAAAQTANAFAESLAEALLMHDISVARFDERFTTTTAARQLHLAGTSAKVARQRIDSAAATVLLEAFLEATRGDDERG